MMYLCKSISNPNNDNFQSRQDLSSYFKLFGFHLRLNRDQVQQIKTMIKENGAAIADVIASQTANLYAEEILKRDKLVSEGLRCCRDFAIDRGYDDKDMQDLIDIGKSAKQNIVLTVGCQTEELLESRVRGTETLCYELALARCNVNVVLSGNNPKKGAKFKIQNESKRMHTLFWQKWGKRKDVDLRKRLLVEILTEGEATKSTQNVEEFVKMKSEILSKHPTNVFLVSSSFHVNRLSLELEKLLIKSPEFQVNNIVLVGAEPVDTPNRVSMHNAYVKTMVFEIYRYLMNLDDYWNYRQ